MATYETLPAQSKYDVDECVNAFYFGGKKLAASTYASIAEARKMKRWEAMALGQIIRDRLATLGYLPIV